MKSLFLPVLRQVIPVILRMTETTIQENGNFFREEIVTMSEVIVITSGKGGVGKTTTVANIGTGLAMLGKKVVVVDTDIGLRNLDVVLGLENRIVYNLVDVINGSRQKTNLLCLRNR